MYCTHCGHEIDPNTNFCIHCGQKNENTTVAQPPYPYAPTASPVTSEAPIPHAPVSPAPPPVSPHTAAPTFPISSHELCCPDCGNHNLQIISESQSHTSGKDFSASKGCCGLFLLGPLGLLCGACGKGKTTTVTNTTYFICPSCGKKFKNPKTLKEEIVNEKNRFRSTAILLSILLLVLSVVTSLLFPVNNGNDMNDMTVFAALLPICGISLIIALPLGYVTSKIRRNTLLKEAQEIEEGMKRHGWNGHNEG